MEFQAYTFDMEIDRTGKICYNAEEFEKEYFLWRQNMTF